MTADVALKLRCPVLNFGVNCFANFNSANWFIFYLWGRVRLVVGVDYSFFSPFFVVVVVLLSGSELAKRT